MSNPKLRRALSAAAGVLALSFAGVVLAQTAPQPAIASFAAPAPAAPAPPAASQVAFSGQLVEAASAFETYTRNAAAIRADFTDGAGVRAALQSGGAYHADQLIAGQVAFAAIVALQDPDFVDAVRSVGADPVLAETLLSHPSAVVRIAGSEGAASLVAAALRARGERVLSTGHAIKQAAYEVQHQSWSLAPVPDAAVALQQSKSLALVRFKAGPEDASLLIKAALAASDGDRTAGGQALKAPMVQRALALAALAVMGRAGDGTEERLQPLLTEAGSAQCLKMSKLNLYQCLSVAGPHYEDVFCLGQHALIDTGQCVIDSAGGPPPAPAVSMVAATVSSAAPPQSISLIPVAATRIALQSR